jgi:hypothetical protein
MNDAFAESDWKALNDRMAWVEGRVHAKGGSVEGPIMLPPVDAKQVEAFTAATGLRLPQDLVDLVTRFAGGWSFSWMLYDREADREIAPPLESRISIFGGNSEVPFVGATRDETLLDLYRQFQEQIGDTFFVDDGDERSRELMPSVFPLHFCEGGGADYTVLRLDTSPCEVVFLDHDAVYAIDDEHVIGRGLGDFLRRWAAVGFPSCEYLLDGVVDPERGVIDEAAPVVRDWLRWLDDPEAR